MLYEYMDEINIAVNKYMFIYINCLYFVCLSFSLSILVCHFSFTFLYVTPPTGYFRKVYQSLKVWVPRNILKYLYIQEVPQIGLVKKYSCYVWILLQIYLLQIHCTGDTYDFIDDEIRCNVIFLLNLFSVQKLISIAKSDCIDAVYRSLFASNLTRPEHRPRRHIYIYR